MKEFIEKLKAVITEVNEGVCHYCGCDLNSEAVTDTIDHVADEYKGGWIPCSERLPSENERWLGKDITDAEPREFIVMVKGAYEPTTGYYTVDGWVKDIYDKDNTSGYANEIIAWRFFPAPYRPEKEEWKDKVMKHFTKVE